MSDSVKPSPSVSGDAPAFAPSPSGEGVGGGGGLGDECASTQPRPAATRQPFDKLRTAKSRCPSPEGVGEVVAQPRPSPEGEGVSSRPAATSAACSDASLAPLAQAGGEGGVALSPLLLAEGAGGGDLAAPPRTGRHNQWTRARMVAFLRELAATQSVAAAARAVGMSRTAAYNLRNRLAGQPFALGWEVALECGMHALAQAVMDRAVNGEEVPLYYHGELVGTTRRYDNRLAQWILENPWRVGRHQMAREYAAGGFDALLERIESASLDWEAGEPVPGPGWPLEEDAAAAAEAQFQRASWYSAEAAETARPARRRSRGFS